MIFEIERMIKIIKLNKRILQNIRYIIKNSSPNNENIKLIYELYKINLRFLKI